MKQKKKNTKKTRKPERLLGSHSSKTRSSATKAKAAPKTKKGKASSVGVRKTNKNNDKPKVTAAKSTKKESKSSISKNSKASLKGVTKKSAIKSKQLEKKPKTQKSNPIGEKEKSGPMTQAALKVSLDDLLIDSLAFKSEGHSATENAILTEAVVSVSSLNVPEKRKRGRPKKLLSSVTVPDSQGIESKHSSKSKAVHGEELLGELLKDYFKEYSYIGSLQEGVRIPFSTSEFEEKLLKMMSIIELSANLNVSLDGFLTTPSVMTSESREDGDSSRVSIAKSTSKVVDLLDRQIERSVAERFVESLEEKIDPSKLTYNNKVYIAKWTNRVAIWRFFERYVVPMSDAHGDEISDYLHYHSQQFEDLAGPLSRNKQVSTVNPFSQYEHAFKVVMKAWMPCIKKIVKIFTTNTRGGANLQDDFLSISYMAFLHALEKQAMAILGNGKLAQGIPFPKRLEFAVRKSIYSELPDLTGPVRVPVESKQRKNMPIEVSLDSWYDDSDY